MYKRLSSLTVAILIILQGQNTSAVPTFSGELRNYTQPDGQSWTNYQYYSNIDIGGCSLTNIGFSGAGGNNTGTFSIDAKTNGCKIEAYLDPENTSYQPPDGVGPGIIGDGAWGNPPNPYYQQRDYTNIGYIAYKNGVISVNDRGVITNTLTNASNTATDANYLMIYSERANTALVEVNPDVTLNVNKNFFINQMVTNASALTIYSDGIAEITGNLDILRQHSNDPSGAGTDSRLLDMRGGTLKVTDNFRTTHLESTISRQSGASWRLTEGSKILVGGNASLYQNTERSAITAQDGSLIDITGDLSIYIDKRANLDHRNDDNAEIISNENSTILANKIFISSEGFRGIGQSGADAVIKTKELNINTTLNEYTDRDNVDRSIILSGGKIVAGTSNLKSNTDVLTVNGISSLSLGENATDINLDTSKALVYLGKDSSITSLSSNGIVIANDLNSEINLQNGTNIIAATNKSIIFDGTGDAIVNVYEGANLTGDMTLGGGNDTINLNGTVDLNKIPKLDGGEISEVSEFNTVNFNASQYTALDTTKFTNFQNFHLKNHSDISLLNNENNIFNASTTDGQGIFIEAGSTLKTQGSFQINSNLSNQGTLDLRKDDTLGNLVTISNDYIGDDGILIINTELNDDSSKTDKLIITGNAKGSTQLQVNKIGGRGAQTIKGIHVIQTGSSESNNTFYLNGGYVSAGAFDYSLHLKEKETTDTGTFDNWYLESVLAKTDPTDPTDPTPKPPIYTPGVGSYLAVATMGNTLFTSRLEDREGASRFQNLENDHGNVWIRAYGGHNKFKSMSDQLKTTGNSFVTQVGTGVVTAGKEDQYNLGIMGGYAHYNGKTRSELTGRKSKANIDGYSLGLYGTWYAHPVEKRGAYIDTWVLWNSFKNKVDVVDRNQYKYDSSGITASIEAGGDYLLNKNDQKDWWIQPQAQLIYQNVTADDFEDAQGTGIYHGSSNLQARLGFKTYLEIPTEVGKETSYRPYIALNYIHNTSPYSVEIANTNYANEGSKNLGEIKLGLEGHLTQNNQVWINASYVAGSHDTQAYQGNIGWKYNF